MEQIGVAPLPTNPPPPHLLEGPQNPGNKTQASHKLFPFVEMGGNKGAAVYISEANTVISLYKCAGESTTVFDLFSAHFPISAQYDNV